MRYPASTSCLERHSCPADRGPNSSSLYPPQAAVVAVALFSRFSDLLLRSWCYALAGREVQRRREIIGGAVNGRSTKNAQQRRPPPAADTGRSCWGRGQQDTSATQGTKWTLGTATRLSAAASFFPFRPLLWGLKGASSPFLVDPARRNRWWFSGSLLTSKENN